MSEEIEIQNPVLEGEVRVPYKWNPGSVIGQFLMDLRQGQLRAVRCPATQRLVLPAQSRSPYASAKMDEFVEVREEPSLKAGSIVYRAPWNKPEGIDPPYMLAAISFPDVATDLIHLVCADLTALKALKPGDALRAVWAEEREGSIRDILYFEPAE